jgi:putative FmdB family regulatory protein
MPIYEYRCDSCGFQKEHLQKMSDRSSPPARIAAGKLRKQLSAAGFQLKGNGWYATDFKGGSKKLTPPPARRGRKLLVVRGQLIKRYFITGLLIWVPLVITGWVLSLIVSTLDQSLRLLPTSIHPQTLLGFAVPGAAVLTLVMILLTGLPPPTSSARSWSSGESCCPHPGRQVDLQQRQAGFRHAFSPNGNAFRKALLVQYPREGSWTIAFQTGAPATSSIICKASMSASMCRPRPTRPPASS